jgi:hypothetical protein
MSPALPSVFERELEALMKVGVTLCRLAYNFFLQFVHYYVLRNIFFSKQIKKKRHAPSFALTSVQPFIGVYTLNCAR